ncbi:hypothetical protein KR038_001272 [Drosophila bunnanda]|nr:hypothetical protein KR038_001272 [Drosophila bunnanda]
MSDEVPLGRLSQIFDTLTNLQQQQQLNPHQQQHQQQQQQLQHHPVPADQRRRSASSSPSPSASASASTSGRATPSLGVASPLNTLQYYSHANNYFLRPQDGGIASGYLHTFPSHLYHHHQHHQQLQQQQLQQQQQQHHQLLQLQHNQPPSLPTQLSGGRGGGCLSGSQSLQGSPLLAKRATSFSGQIPLGRVRSGTAGAGVAGAAASTPNSPRLMPRRVPRPPPIPAKPGQAKVESRDPPVRDLAQNPTQANVNPVLAALDAPDAPWPHFSTLTEHLDVHQVNNYGQALPEVSLRLEIYLNIYISKRFYMLFWQINWQERCLELQLELHRSKNQAGRIRDMLREKVSAFAGGGEGKTTGKV